MFREEQTRGGGEERAKDKKARKKRKKSRDRERKKDRGKERTLRRLVPRRDTISPPVVSFFTKPFSGRANGRGGTNGGEFYIGAPVSIDPRFLYFPRRTSRRILTNLAKPPSVIPQLYFISNYIDI